MKRDKYYLDTEFNGYGGELISIALVHESGRSIYLIDPSLENPIDPWVAENVYPKLLLYPTDNERIIKLMSRSEMGKELATFINSYDNPPLIISDYPSAIKYFCDIISTGPSTVSALNGIQFEIKRVDSYPTLLEGAIQHNALWDARAHKNTLEASPGFDWKWYPTSLGNDVIGYAPKEIIMSNTNEAKTICNVCGRSRSKALADHEHKCEWGDIMHWPPNISGFMEQLRGHPTDVNPDIGDLREAALTMQIAVGRILENGGLNIDEWWDTLTEAQRRLANATKATRAELDKLSKTKG